LHSIAITENSDGDPGEVFVWGDDINQFSIAPRELTFMSSKICFTNIKIRSDKQIISVSSTALETFFVTKDHIVYKASVDKIDKPTIQISDTSLKISSVSCGGNVIFTQIKLFSFLSF
jgi:hypothetical protein